VAVSVQKTMQIHRDEYFRMNFKHPALWIQI